MPSLISHLTAAGRRELMDDLNYLNIGEFRTFCDAHSIPYAIWIETGDGKVKKTRDTDRKAVVLERIRHYLKTGRVMDRTVFAAAVVCLDSPPAVLKSTHRLYYGWYDKYGKGMTGLLKRLTGGKFRDGAIARLLIREYWTEGRAPTYAEYAKAWLEYNARGLGPHPEAAWLTDWARQEAGTNWKAKREQKARRVLKVLGAIRP